MLCALQAFSASVRLLTQAKLDEVGVVAAFAEKDASTPQIEWVSVVAVLSWILSRERR